MLSRVRMIIGLRVQFREIWLLVGDQVSWLAHVREQGIFYGLLDV